MDKKRKKSSSKRLSITAEYDDLSRMQSGLVNSYEDDVIRLLKSHSEVQRKLQDSLKVIQELKKANFELTTENVRLNKLLKTTRSNLASEAQRVNHSEKELRRLKQKLAIVDGLAKDDPRKVDEIIRETMSRISYLDISDGSLSDIAFDTSEDDYLDNVQERSPSSGIGSSSPKDSPTALTKPKIVSKSPEKVTVAKPVEKPRRSSHPSCPTTDKILTSTPLLVQSLMSSKSTSGLARAALSVVHEEDELEQSLRSLETKDVKEVKRHSKDSTPSGYSSTSSIEHPECSLPVNDYDRLFSRPISNASIASIICKKNKTNGNHFLDKIFNRVHRIF